MEIVYDLYGLVTHSWIKFSKLEIEEQYENEKCTSRNYQGY